jgi:FAD/FMN-containing dehydrogenase
MKKLWAIFDKYELLKNDIKWIASCLGAERAYATGWITIFVPTRDKMELGLKAWNEMLDEIIDSGACPYWSGLLWEERAVERAKKPFLDLYWSIKHAIDPENIMAPGVFTGGK